MKTNRGKSIIILILFVLLFVSICVIISLSSGRNYSIIVEPSELFEIVNCKRSDILIVDLRDEEEYIRGHIDISINLPLDDEGEKLLEYLARKKYDNRDIYLLCQSGYRSSSAFNILIENGYHKVHNIRFGYEEYYQCYKDDYVPAVGICNCKD